MPSILPSTLRRALACLPLAGVLIAQAPPVLAAPAEAILPESCYATFRFGGLGACRDAAAAMPLAAVVEKFLQNVPAEVRAKRLDQGLEHAAQQLQKQCTRLGLRVADLRAVLGQPMTVAIGRLSIDGFGPSVALVIEAGEQKPAINRIVQWGAKLIAQRAGGAESGMTEIGGGSFHTLVPANGPMLLAGSVGNCYVVTNSRGLLGEMVAVAAGKQPALTKATRLGELHRELPAPALASLFLNAGRVLSAFAPHLPYEAEQWSQALGIGGVDAIYWGVAADARGGADLCHLGVGGSERGLLKALVAAPADLSFAQACSPNTVAFAAGSFDVGAVIDAFHQFVELLPPTARQHVLHGLQHGLGDAGASREAVEGVVRAFGTQVGVALALEKGAVPKPELLVRIAVRDPEQVRALLQDLEGMAAEQGGLEWKTRKADDHEVRFCNLPLPQASLQLSPCYALAKDALWLGSDAAALVRALRQDPQQSLAAQSDFGDLQETARDASGVVHWRLFRAAEIGWRTVETMLYPQLDAHAHEIGFGSEALPDAETVAKALGTMTCVYRVDDAGITMQSRGLLTWGAMLAALGFAGDEVLSRATGKVF